MDVEDILLMAYIRLEESGAINDFHQQIQENATKLTTIDLSGQGNVLLYIICGCYMLLYNMLIVSAIMYTCS